MFQLHTPGGGGYGSPETEGDVVSLKITADGGEFSKFVERGSVYEYRQAQEGV